MSGASCPNGLEVFRYTWPYVGPVSFADSTDAVDV
jgi:hypothetical protein